MIIVNWTKRNLLPLGPMKNVLRQNCIYMNKELHIAQNFSSTKTVNTPIFQK